MSVTRYSAGVRRHGSERKTRMSLRDRLVKLPAATEAAPRPEARPGGSRGPDTSDCVSLANAAPYEMCRVAGIVRRVWIDPLQRTIEATIVDGTGSASARWAMQARPRLEILPGAGLILEGDLRMDGAGRLFMVEPAFEVVRDPESLPQVPTEGRPPLGPAPPLES